MYIDDKINDECGGGLDMTKTGNDERGGKFFYHYVYCNLNLHGYR